MVPEDPLRNERLLEVALRVTDGLPVDWALERTGMPDADRGLESLALIASIAAAGQQSSEASNGPPLFVWGEHRVLQKLGEGRFGTQYIAWDETLGREVVLELGHSNPGAARSSARHLDGIRRLMKIHHPNLVGVHGVEGRDGRTGIWFERLHGRSLEEDLVARGPMGGREAALIGIDLCAALDALHACGLVHGAIQTSNVIREGVPGSLHNAGRVVLTWLSSSAPVADRSPTAPDDFQALGVLLYRLVTGVDPSSDAGIGLRSIRPDLPMTLVQVIEKTLAGNTDHGFRDAAAIQRALLPVLGVEAGTVRRPAHFHWRWRTVLIGAAAVAGAIAVARPPRVLRAWVHRPAKVSAISSHLRLSVIGTLPNAWFGYYSGVSAGDVNDDGAPDLLWGSPFADDGRGRAYILFGGSRADSIPDVVLTGSTPQENFGNSVAGLGDANGDGFADFAVAAQGDDAVHSDAGRVEVYFGGPALDTRPDVILAGRQAEQLFGFWLTAAGDLNGDGFADLAVGAPMDDAAGKWSGRVFVYFGGASMDSVADLELTSNTTMAQFGMAVAGAGDLNGDGHPDLAVGSYMESVDGPAAGRIYLYWGGPGLDAQHDLVLPGHAPQENLCKVAAAGDVDGDGFDDLAVGAEYGDGLQRGSGLVYVYLGGPTIDEVADVVLRGEGSGDLFGCWVSGPGDLNQDGFTDLFIGARRSDANGHDSGAVYLFFGGRNMDAEPDLRLVGEAAYFEMGSACGSAGDFFGDGFPDLFVSTHGYTSSVASCGRVDILDVSRYAILNPVLEPTSQGAPLVVRWAGSEKTTVSASVDHGQSWTRVARRAGGDERNEISIPIPLTAASETLLVRLAPADASIPGAVVTAFPIRRP